MGEAPRRITDYLSRFSDVVSSPDGSALKPLLAVSSNSPYLLSLADALNVFQDPRRLVNQTDTTPSWERSSSLTTDAFRTTGIDAYVAFEKAEFRNWDRGWAIEATRTVVLKIRPPA